MRGPRDPKVPWDVPRRITPPVQGGAGAAFHRANAVARASGLPAAVPGQGVGGGEIVEAPLYQSPVPGTRPINRSGVVAGLTAAGSPVTPAGLRLELQPGNMAVLRSLTLNVNDMVQTTDVRYSVLFGGSPVEGWNDLRIFPRLAASVSVTFEPSVTMILVPEGGVVDVRITVLDAGTYQVGASYTGWRFSTSMAERFGLSGIV